MPNKDRTGPLGQGSLTGRGLGFCCPRFGLRRVFGRDSQSVELTKDQEKKILEAEKSEIEKRLKELK